MGAILKYGTDEVVDSWDNFDVTQSKNMGRNMLQRRTTNYILCTKSIYERL